MLDKMNVLLLRRNYSSTAAAVVNKRILSTVTQGPHQDLFVGTSAATSSSSASKLRPLPTAVINSAQLLDEVKLDGQKWISDAQIANISELSSLRLPAGSLVRVEYEKTARSSKSNGRILNQKEIIGVGVWNRHSSVPIRMLENEALDVLAQSSEGDVVTALPRSFLAYRSGGRGCTTSAAEEVVLASHGPSSQVDVDEDAAEGADDDENIFADGDETTNDEQVQLSRRHCEDLRSLLVKRLTAVSTALSSSCVLPDHDHERIGTSNEKQRSDIAARVSIPFLYTRILDADADGFPGLSVDRHGFDAAVLTYNTLGSYHCYHEIVEKTLEDNGITKIAQHKLISKKERYYANGAEFATSLVKGTDPNFLVREVLPEDGSENQAQSGATSAGQLDSSIKGRDDESDIMDMDKLDLLTEETSTGKNKNANADTGPQAPISNVLDFTFNVYQHCSLGYERQYDYSSARIRSYLANLVKDKQSTVLDLWCHLGETGLRCASQGKAEEVILIEEREHFAVATLQNAKRNGATANRTTVLHKKSIFTELRNMALAGLKFSLVVCNPPLVFAQRKKDRRKQVALDGDVLDTVGGAGQLQRSTQIHDQDEQRDYSQIAASSTCPSGDHDLPDEDGFEQVDDLAAASTEAGRRGKMRTSAANDKSIMVQEQTPLSHQFGKRYRVDLRGICPILRQAAQVTATDGYIAVKLYLSPRNRSWGPHLLKLAFEQADRNGSIVKEFASSSNLPRIMSQDYELPHWFVVRVH
ncbi:unnamed protein product [Amoebophrya sp. A120]|nr:unnamed protein product [Amoebophrya sp. A120]|eukprot:GSA120T00008254001.1